MSLCSIKKELEKYNSLVPTAISANASQVLFDFGRIKHGTVARRYELTYLKESIGAKRAEIILKSIQAFSQVLQGQKLKRVRKKNLEGKN